MGKLLGSAEPKDRPESASVIIFSIFQNLGITTIIIILYYIIILLLQNLGIPTADLMGKITDN